MHMPLTSLPSGFRAVFAGILFSLTRIDPARFTPRRTFAPRWYGGL